MINILCQVCFMPKKHKQNHLKRIMKLSVLLLCITFSVFAHNADSQNAKVSLNKQNVAVHDILNAIEEQTDYLFLYNKQNVNVNRLTSVSSNI